MPKPIEPRSGKEAVLYVRVSDESQVVRGHSIHEQEPMLRKFATENGYIVTKVFADKGKSATSTVGREELEKALLFIEQNKNVAALLVVDTDRLARSENDHFAIRAFLRKQGVRLLSKNQPAIDESIEGRLLDTIMAGVNAFQSRMTGRKVSTIFERMTEQGKTTRQAPIGYLNVNKGTDERPDRKVEINPITAKFVTEAFELYGSGGYSISELVWLMTKKGMRSLRGKRLHSSSMTNILSNPYYTGKIRYKGKLYKGLHEPLINDELFQRCKDVLARNNQYAIRKRVPENHTAFFLRGFLKCGICGHRITASRLPKKEKNYYYCSVKKGEKGHHSNAGQTTNINEIENLILGFFSILELGAQRSSIRLWNEPRKY